MQQRLEVLTGAKDISRGKWPYSHIVRSYCTQRSANTSTPYSASRVAVYRTAAPRHKPRSATTICWRNRAHQNRDSTAIIKTNRCALPRYFLLSPDLKHEANKRRALRGNVRTDLCRFEGRIRGVVISGEWKQNRLLLSQWAGGCQHPLMGE